MTLETGITSLLFSVTEWSFHRPTKFEVLTAVLLKIQTWNVTVYHWVSSSWY